MENLLDSISQELLVILAVNLLLIIILFIMSLYNSSKIRKMQTKHNKFMNGLSDRNIEELLETHMQMVREVKDKNVDIENHMNNIERVLLQCVQKVGIIRYNAFSDVGSDLSFSIAILDSNDNGFVLSGIYARENSSTYSKPLLNGSSRYPLSVEEMQAIDMAKKSFRERLYTDK